MITICLAFSLFPLPSTVFAFAIAACKLVPPFWELLGMFNLLLMNLVTVVLLSVISWTSITWVPNSTIPIFTVPLLSIKVLAKSVAAFLASSILVFWLNLLDWFAILFELSNINTMSSLPFVTTDVLYEFAFTDRFTLAYLPFSRLSVLVSS